MSACGVQAGQRQHFVLPGRAQAACVRVAGDYDQIFTSGDQLTFVGRAERVSRTGARGHLGVGVDMPGAPGFVGEAVDASGCETVQRVLRRFAAGNHARGVKSGWRRDDLLVAVESVTQCQGGQVCEDAVQVRGDHL